MHYIRFLKPPSISQLFKSSKDIQISTKITITSDLGESFLCFDLPLTVVLLDDQGSPSQTHLFEWKATYRQLEISFPVYKSAQLTKDSLKWPIRVVIQPQRAHNRLEELAHLLQGSIKMEEQSALVLPILSSLVHRPAPPVVSRMAQRVFKMAAGELLYIWEETGESIARHIWDAGLVMSAYLDGLCQGNGQSSVKQLSSLQRLLMKEKLQVLELGAGCGIVGLALGKSLPKAKITLTDLYEAKDIAEHNIWVNGTQTKLNHRDKARIQYQMLDWEDPLPEKQRNEDIDLVLVADCTYNPDVVPDLVKTLAELLQYNKDIIILLGMKVRHESEKIFFDLMAEKPFIILDKLMVPLPLLGQDAEEIEIYTFAGNQGQIC